MAAFFANRFLGETFDFRFFLFFLACFWPLAFLAGVGADDSSDDDSEEDSVDDDSEDELSEESFDFRFTSSSEI